MADSDKQSRARAAEAKPAGHRLVDWVDVAARKDGGVTAGQLAWVLEQVHIDDGASLPGDVAVVELREFIKNLTRELRDVAFPTP